MNHRLLDEFVPLFYLVEASIPFNPNDEIAGEQFQPH